MIAKNYLNLIPKMKRKVGLIGPVGWMKWFFSALLEMEIIIEVNLDRFQKHLQIVKYVS